MHACIRIELNFDQDIFYLDLLVAKTFMYLHAYSYVYMHVPLYYF